jgi:hypothetical protein
MIYILSAKPGHTWNIFKSVCFEHILSARPKLYICTCVCGYVFVDKFQFKTLYLYVYIYICIYNIYLGLPVGFHHVDI